MPSSITSRRTRMGRERQKQKISPPMCVSAMNPPPWRLTPRRRSTKTKRKSLARGLSGCSENLGLQRLSQKVQIEQFSVTAQKPGANGGILFKQRERGVV